MGDKLVSLFILFFISGCSTTNHYVHSDPDNISARIIDFGIYRLIKSGKNYSLPQSTAGYATKEVDTVQIKRTANIPLKKGIIFGFEWTASGFEPGTRTVIHYYVKHPEITKPDGKKMKEFNEPFSIYTFNGTVWTKDYYCLSEDFELVPGEWTLSVFYQGKELVSKTFTVSKHFKFQPSD